MDVASVVVVIATVVVISIIVVGTVVVVITTVVVVVATIAACTVAIIYQVYITEVTVAIVTSVLVFAVDTVAAARGTRLPVGVVVAADHKAVSILVVEAVFAALACKRKWFNVDQSGSALPSLKAVEVT